MSSDQMENAPSRLSESDSVSQRVNGDYNQNAPVRVTQLIATRGGTSVLSDMEKDWRIRLSLPKGNSLFYKEINKGLLWPLSNDANGTNGVIFPYTPQITVTHEAQYDSVQTTHSNYMNYFYKGSVVNAIQIQGEFTAQNEDEGRYVLAAIYFLRSVTKMFFGQTPGAGNPPVVLMLNGYGSHYFPNIPVVVTSFAHSMPNDVDYIPITVKMDDGTYDPRDYRVQANKTPEITRIPTTSSITVTVQPIYSRTRLYDKYNLASIARGDLLSPGSNFL